ncbi:DNA ligase (ATP) [Rhizopus stolonifer]|uniref:DNA ligase (ATP) n=1 Tax=Rhizopus stolonifer TaxID=4846 RepID=A0A367K8V4_RHIST|nr:DNA ligase (ATP) [Rhizopus stolonifer]
MSSPSFGELYAKNAYDCGQDLYYICHELTSPSAKFNDDNISMFYPITPQRGVKSTNAEFKKFDAENQKMFLKHGRSEAPYFYVEEKIDGDRMQLHYNPDIDKFMWFTRNHNNFTERFGSSSKDIGKLSSRIYKGLPSKRSVVF